MTNIWMTADSHFRHANIIKYCNRPFKSAKEMDETLLANINDVVQPNDILYHLGDFVFGQNKCDAAIEYRRKIRCNNIIFLYGNHDDRYYSEYNIFSSHQHYLEHKINKQWFVMCHYPIISWNRMSHGSIMLHGHCHANLGVKQGKMFDVGVDAEHEDGTKYKPFSMDEILSMASKMEINKVDHHE